LTNANVKLWPSPRTTKWYHISMMPALPPKPVVLEGQNADLRVELGDPPYRSGATRRIRQRARVLTNADNAFRVRFMR